MQPDSEQEYGNYFIYHHSLPGLIVVVVVVVVVVVIVVVVLTSVVDMDVSNTSLSLNDVFLK